MSGGLLSLLMQAARSAAVADGLVAEDDININDHGNLNGRPNSVSSTHSQDQFAIEHLGCPPRVVSQQWEAVHAATASDVILAGNDPKTTQVESPAARPHSGSSTQSDQLQQTGYLPKVELIHQWQAAHTAAAIAEARFSEQNPNSIGLENLHGRQLSAHSSQSEQALQQEEFTMSHKVCQHWHSSQSTAVGDVHVADDETNTSDSRKSAVRQDSEISIQAAEQVVPEDQGNVNQEINPQHSQTPYTQPSSTPISSAGSNGGGKKKVPSLRRGKWTAEEEAYANRLIQEFKAGLLPLTEGTTLRTFLSELLNCDPMRISKKFVGSNCIGKQVFRRRTADVGRLTAEQLAESRKELAELERKFLERVCKTTRVKNASSVGIISPASNSSPVICGGTKEDKPQAI